MTTDAATILIVDDEPAIRRFIRNTLVVHGHRVVEADSAASGLSAVRHYKPDVVILDLGLPDRDGLEVIRELRAVSALPIVVLSSRGDEQAKVAALDLGADD